MKLSLLDNVREMQAKGCLFAYGAGAETQGLSLKDLEVALTAPTCEHTTWPPPGYPDLEVCCNRILNTDNENLLRDTARYVARVVLKTLKSP